MTPTATIILLLHLILNCALGTICAFISYFLEYCFFENSIFSGYLPRLAKLCLKYWKPAKLKALDSAKQNPQYDNMLLQEASNLFLFKILGGCVFCSNVWLCAICFSVGNIFMGLNWLYMLPLVVFSHFVLRKIHS